MQITFQYPVVYFYSDDYEDSEVIPRFGNIEPINVSSEPYEAVVNAEGYSFHILCGSYQNGMFLCIPNWHLGCELSYLNDVFWNLESINGIDDSFNYENATAIAYALKELDALIKQRRKSKSG